jgi:hypothetical protein
VITDLGTVSGVRVTLRYHRRRGVLAVWWRADGRIPWCREIPLGQLSVDQGLDGEALDDLALLWRLAHPEERRKRRRA